jgi:hypothetical protein
MTDDHPEHALLTSAQREELITGGAHLRGLPPTAYAQTLLSGKAPVFACAADPRASFTVYAPANHSFADENQQLRVVVSIHGTARDMRLIDKMGPSRRSAACSSSPRSFRAGSRICLVRDASLTFVRRADNPVRHS